MKVLFGDFNVMEINYGRFKTFRRPMDTFSPKLHDDWIGNWSHHI